MQIGSLAGELNFLLECWRDLPPSSEKLRWRSVSSVSAVAEIHVFALDVARFQKWILRAAVLFGIGVIFVATFALTSPWAVAELKFFPDLYIMTKYVNFGHGAKADWYGPRWITDLGGKWGLGPVMMLPLAALGIAGVLAQWRSARFYVPATPLIIVAGWTVFYLTFMIMRVNLARPYYLLPMVPATAIMAGCGVALLRKAMERYLGGRQAQVALLEIMALCLGGEAIVTAPVLASNRAGIMTNAIAPEKVAMANWLDRCISSQDGIMTAAYSYVPPHFTNAYLNTDQGGHDRLMYYKPSVVILNSEDIDMFTGPVADVSTNVTGTTDDKVKYFSAVARSDAWKAGPVFGRYRVYLERGFFRSLSETKKECFP